MADLSEQSGTETEQLKASWQRGEVIAVIRHLERCDRHDVPCWRDPVGITERSLVVGEALAEDFAILGLEQTDIFHSPQIRTTETSLVVFGEAGQPKEWLYACKENRQLLDAALAAKQQQRNLILVTHSSCMDEFEEDFGFSSDKPEYATTLFVIPEPLQQTPQLLGFVDAEDWELTFGW